MRILIAHSSYRVFGGEDRYVQELSALLRPGHEVELFTRSNLEIGGGAITGARMLYSRRLLESTEKTIDRVNPDVVHLHNVYPGLGPAVHVAARRRQVPVIMTVHNFRLRCPNGYMFTEGMPCRRCERGVYAHSLVHDCFPTKKQSAAYALALWIHRFILKLEKDISLFIAPSEFMRDRLIEWGIEREKTELIRPFTTLSPSGAAPGRYGLYLGRISSEKGLDWLLRALALAGDPAFRIVGDGPLRAPLEQLMRDLGIQNTEFTGGVTPQEAAKELEGSSYLVMPSLCDENAPLAAVEAMTAGRPLLVSDRGGLPELAGDERGFIAKAGDDEDLAAKIRVLSEDPGLCARKGARAQKYARTHLNSSNHLAKLESAYERVRA